MIEVNLLPGAKRGKKSGGGPSLNFAAIGAAISERVKDKWLAAAVLTGIAAVGIIAALFLSQNKKQASLREAEAAAVADSARYAAVLNDRARLEARRDSALIQLNIIRAIDDERFIWSHVLDEISRAMPPYTWLRDIRWNGTQQGLNPPAAYRAPVDTGASRRRRRGPPVLPRDTLRVRLIGRTVDVQALTRLYRNLEDSPFLGAVQLVKSEIGPEGGKEVTQFTLDFMYTRPDSMMIRRAPFTAAAPR
jgi:Tfp pilus assembly protein PilN